MKPLNSTFVMGMMTGAAILGAGLLLGGAHETAVPQQEPVTEVVRARQFEVVDELGTVTLVVGSNGDGGSISVRDRFGKTLLLLAADDEGGTLIANEAANGRPALTLGAGNDGEGTITAFGAGGAPALKIFADVAGGGVLETYRADGPPLVTISQTEGGHGQLSTFANHDKPLVTLTATQEHEGQLYTYGAAGKPLIALASRPPSDEAPGGPTLRIFNRHGEAIVSLESDQEDEGVIGAWKRDGTGRTFAP